MARSIWSGFLSFGLVNIPVGLYPATRDRTVHFNQFHRGTSHRIRYRKVDEVTGEDVDTADIVSGYHLGEGEYVTVTREELRQVAPGKSETIEISDFVDLTEIDPVHFRQSYYLAPNGKGADRAYALLRRAMQETDKAGIATFILRDKEHLVAVRPGTDALILQTMYFADEILNPREELDNLPLAIEIADRELEIAKRLVESLTTAWSPDRYQNTYRARVMELIERKRAGTTLVVEAEHPTANVIDLMAALEASVARVDTSRRGGASRPSSSRDTEAAPARPRTSDKRQPQAMSKTELMARAAELHVPGRSKMSKQELAAAVAAAERPKRGRRRVS